MIAATYAAHVRIYELEAARPTALSSRRAFVGTGHSLHVERDLSGKTLSCRLQAAETGSGPLDVHVLPAILLDPVFRVVRASLHDVRATAELPWLYAEPEKFEKNRSWLAMARDREPSAWLRLESLTSHPEVSAERGLVHARFFLGDSGKGLLFTVHGEELAVAVAGAMDRGVILREGLSSLYGPRPVPRGLALPEDKPR